MGSCPPANRLRRSETEAKHELNGPASERNRLLLRLPWFAPAPIFHEAREDT
jgi:hypothetical protein